MHACCGDTLTGQSGVLEGGGVVLRKLRRVPLPCLGRRSPLWAPLERGLSLLCPAPLSITALCCRRFLNSKVPWYTNTEA